MLAMGGRIPKRFRKRGPASRVYFRKQLKQLIDSHGEQIFILPLQGYIFFGTSNRILDRIQERLDNEDINDLKYLIFTFNQVTGIDSSTINSFNKLFILAENKNRLAIVTQMYINKAKKTNKKLRKCIHKISNAGY